MQNVLTAIALVLALAAAGVAGYALVENQALRAELEAQDLLSSVDIDTGAAPESVTERLAAVEERLERVDDAVATSVLSVDAPTLEGRPVLELPALGSEEPSDGAVATEELRALVDEAVDRKAMQIQRMKNKKPTMDAFAEVLELSDAQRIAVKDEVIRGQREIWAILETPTDDGSVLMDELVEIVASGMANPGQDPGAGKRFFARVLAESFPGSDDTFATRIETVKSSVRESFRRDLSAEQYGLFEAWEMDPIEVHGIEGSPRSELYARIKDRARQLGADLPDENDGR